MKSNLKYILYLILIIFNLPSYYVYAVPIDFIAGGGYSIYNYDYNSTTSSSTMTKETGYNANMSLLICSNLNPAIDIVMGPKIKYENTSATDEGSSYTLTETFTTLQVGAEAGLKFNISDSLVFYTTLFASTGVMNTLTEEYSNGGNSLPNQTINVVVTRSNQEGIIARLFYKIIPNVGLGLGGEFSNGSYLFEESAIKTSSRSVTVPPGANKYSAENINLQFAYFFN